MLVRPDHDGVCALFPSSRHHFSRSFLKVEVSSRAGGVVADASLCLLRQGLFVFLLLLGCVHPSRAEAVCGLYRLYHLDVNCLSLIKSPFIEKKLASRDHGGEVLKLGTRSLLEPVERRRVPWRWLFVDLLTCFTIEKDIHHIQLKGTTGKKRQQPVRPEWWSCEQPEQKS